MRSAGNRIVKQLVHLWPEVNALLAGEQAFTNHFAAQCAKIVIVISQNQVHLLFGIRLAWYELVGEFLEHNHALFKLHRNLDQLSIHKEGA